MTDIKDLPTVILDSKKSRVPVTPSFFVAVGYILGTIFIVYLALQVQKAEVRKQVPLAPVPPSILTPTPTPSPTPSVLRFNGQASYYSREGCLGCSETLTMANGETLDDDRLTIAMTPSDVRNHKLLNKVVTVRNVKTNLTTQAKVTDTGGFGKYARIADISVAVKRTIQCNDLCAVEITVD